MEQILTIARNEFRNAFKDKLFIVVTILFLFLSILSVYIGSATKNAELTAYNDIVNLLKSQGNTNFPPEPEIFPLAILQNIIVYVGMVGAILSVFLGFNSFSEEREEGTMKLILTRPIYRDQILNGKLLGGALVIGLLLGFTLAFNLILFILVSGMAPGINEILRLLIFFALAFYYMMSFYILSILISIKSKSSSFSFMFLLIIWVGITFVIPQMAESQKNYAFVLNNISQTVNKLPSDTGVSKFIDIFSPMVQFQKISRDLLQVVPSSALFSAVKILKQNFLHLIYLIFPGIIMLFTSYIVFLKEEN